MTWWCRPRHLWYFQITQLSPQFKSLTKKCMTLRSKFRHEAEYFLEECWGRRGLVIIMLNYVDLFSLNDSLWPNIRYLSKRLSQIWLMIYWPPSCTLLGSVVWSDDVRLTQITIYWNILVLNIHVWPYQCPRNLPDVNTHKEVNRQHCSI